MSLPLYKLYRTKDKTIDLNLDGIKKVLDAIAALPQKISLASISLQVGLNLVPHTLNKPLTSYSTRLRSQVDVWDSQDDPVVATLPNIYLYLNASAPCVIDLEVW
jgi:hypothetical protein